MLDDLSNTGPTVTPHYSSQADVRAIWAFNGAADTKAISMS